MLPVQQHDGTGGPGEHLERCRQRSGQGRIIQCLGPVLRIDDAEQDEADGEDAGRIAEHKDRPFKPAALVHGRSEVHERQEDDDEPGQDEEQQRHGIFHDDGDLDGGNAEEHQVIRRRSGQAVDDLRIDIFFHAGLPEDQVQDEGKDEGKQIGRKLDMEASLDELVQHHADAGSSQQDGQMEGNGIEDHGRNGFLADGIAVPFLDQTGLQVAGNVGKALDVLGPPLLRGQVDEEQSAEDTRQDADGGTGHGDVHAVFEAQFLKDRAHGCCRPVTAGEAGCQAEAEAVADLREQLRNDEDGEQGSQAELDGLGEDLIGEIGTHAVKLGFEVALADGKPVHPHGSKDDDDQDPRIGSDGFGKGQDIGTLFAQCQGNEAGDHARRDKEFLYNPHLGPDQLTHQDQQRSDGKVHQNISNAHFLHPS